MVEPKGDEKYSICIGCLAAVEPYTGSQVGRTGEEHGCEDSTKGVQGVFGVERECLEEIVLADDLARSAKWKERLWERKRIK